MQINDEDQTLHILKLYQDIKNASNSFEKGFF